MSIFRKMAKSRVQKQEKEMKEVYVAYAELPRNKTEIICVSYDCESAKHAVMEYEYMPIFIEELGNGFDCIDITTYLDGHRECEAWRNGVRLSCKVVLRISKQKLLDGT